MPFKPINIRSNVDGRRVIVRRRVCFSDRFQDCAAQHVAISVIFVQFDRALEPDEAIAVSCNVFFHTIAHQMRLEGIEHCYEAYGVGQPFDLGIDLEHVGRLTPFGGRRTDINDAVMMGIGQGPVTWTPR